MNESLSFLYMFVLLLQYNCHHADNDADVSMPRWHYIRGPRLQTPPAAIHDVDGALCWHCVMWGVPHRPIIRLLIEELALYLFKETLHLAVMAGNMAWMSVCMVEGTLCGRRLILLYFYTWTISDTLLKQSVRSVDTYLTVSYKYNLFFGLFIQLNEAHDKNSLWIRTDILPFFNISNSFQNNNYLFRKSEGHVFNWKY